MATRTGERQGGDRGTAGRLRARPVAGVESGAGRTGRRPLGLDPNRDGLLYVPKRYDASRPYPLVVLLHGAGADAQDILPVLRREADASDFIVVAPDSRAGTWDVIMGGFGPDVEFIDRALEQIFVTYAIDPAHVAIAGFSDGASYALSLGITNGDLFTDVMAFSPGFMAPGQQRGAPRIFISHGVDDRVLPIDRCGRRVTPVLREAGYDVEYIEFEGGHTVPQDIAADAAEWFLSPSTDGAS